MKFKTSTRTRFLATVGLLTLAASSVATAGTPGYVRLTNGGPLDLHGAEYAPAPTPVPDNGVSYGGSCPTCQTGGYEPAIYGYGGGCENCEPYRRPGVFGWLKHKGHDHGDLVGGVNTADWECHEGTGHGHGEMTTGKLCGHFDGGHEWLMHRLHTRYGYFCPTGGSGYGVPWAGHYSMVYPTNPYYFDHRDGQVFSAQGYGTPMAVPLAPNVGYTYNYGWGMPSSRLTPISRRVPQGNYAVPVPYAGVYDSIGVQD